MQGKHAVILYHCPVTWWQVGAGGVVLGPSINPHTCDGGDYSLLRAFYELTVINGNESAIFYWGNKENSEMRSRTK